MKLDPNPPRFLLVLEILYSEADHLVRVDRFELQVQSAFPHVSTVAQFVNQSHQSQEITANHCYGRPMELRRHIRFIEQVGHIVTCFWRFERASDCWVT